MEQWKKNTYVLWLAMFIAAICWTMVMPFTTVYLNEMGVHESAQFWAGIIISAASFCSMIMAPIWGAVGDRFGRRMMMLRAGFFLALGYVLLTQVQGPVGLLLVRMMVGTLTGFVPMAIALVGVSTPQKHMGYALGIVQTAYPSGAIIGPVVGGVLADITGVRGSSWVAAVFIALATLLVLVQVKEEFAPPPSSKRNLLEDLKVAAQNPVIVAVIAITGAAQASIMALEPVLVPFVRQIAGANAPGWLSGLLFSLPGVAFIGMAPWWTRRGDKVGFARTVAIGLLGSAVLDLSQAFVTGPWQMGTLRLISGVAGAAIGPGVAALLATAVPRDLRGRAYGLNQSAASAGSIIGPLLGGYIGSYINPRGVFILTATIYVLAWVWVKRTVAPRVRTAMATVTGD